MSSSEPPPRPVKPEALPMPPTEEELEFHRLALIDIETNLDQETLVFSSKWIRMWIEFDRRMMHELGHRKNLHG